MAARILPPTNPLIVDGDTAQTAANCAAVTTWVANANFDSVSDELDLGHFLILETVAAALRSIEDRPSKSPEVDHAAH